MDASEERDKIQVTITTERGEEETVQLEETLSHSGAFSGAFKLTAVDRPTPGSDDGKIEAFFGETMTVSYRDTRSSSIDEQPVHTATAKIAIGTNGLVSSFSKVFENEDLAIQTQFHIAESFFELFKSHLDLGREDEAKHDLTNGLRVLRELTEDYPNPKYAARVSYLRGQFAQELKNWNEAIDAYEDIIRNHGESSLASDAQYKLAQCYEEADRFDDALEAYVTLASTYPDSPLIANVMVRINEYFYKNENFPIAAQVGKKFTERFQENELAPKMAFRVGQCFYKSEDYKVAGQAFDEFVKNFPDDKLASEALFWSGESYRMGNNVPEAFRRYNRCRWDFPESDAAKYARGRLALPEMLEQFQREANVE
jgi:TolA-binding protein